MQRQRNRQRNKTKRVRVALAVFAVSALVAGSGAAASRNLSRSERTSAGRSPAFGDSGWVAPYPNDALRDKPSDPGPRVAKPHGEPAGEKILRTPFRVAFLPIRLFARGLEWVVGEASDRFAPPPQYSRRYQNLRLTPTADLSGTTGPAVGAVLTLIPKFGSIDKLSFGGIVSWKHHLKFSASERLATPLPSWLLEFDQQYAYRPSYRFYGMGNATRKEDRSVYLLEETHLDGAIRRGQGTGRVLSILGGYSNMGSRKATRETPHLETLFNPATIPFFGQSTQLAYYGLGADVSTSGLGKDPVRGLRFMADARRYSSVDKFHLDYLQTQLESRAYVPVFSDRRVLAARVAYDVVSPRSGSDPIPFYRLPESAGTYRFSGFNTHLYRDTHLALAHLEYRWIIWRNVWSLAFLQEGEVASSAKAFTLPRRHESIGWGLRMVMSPRSTARFEVGHSKNGMVLDLSLGQEF